MRLRVSCPYLVGRSEEFGRLRDALARAERGVPTTVIVSGEAGIGKTRLLNDFAAETAEAAQFLRGGCVPLTDGLLPYGPVVELLRSIAEGTGRDILLDLPAPDRAALLGFLPELAEPSDPWDAVPLADHHVLFAALRRLLHRLAATGTVVIVLEDLHWADPSTLALLAYLAHGMRTMEGRLLLLGTYRSDELSRRHPLRSLLAELDRGGVSRIELRRFGLDETAAQISGVLNATAEPALVEHLHARCDGNPFLIEELLAAGPDVDPLPEDTRDILLRRVRRLPLTDQRLLLAVAVAGGWADHDLLAQAVEATDDGLLLDELHAAVEDQILVVVADGYAFRHTLVAEALAAEALPGERMRLHRRYAETLARRWDSRGEAARDSSPARAAAAAAVAHHWCRAGDPARGVLASIEAGLAAEQLFAQAEARQHFERAITLWDDAPQAHPDAALDLVELYRHCAEAAYLEGDTPHAIDLIHRALAVEPESDPLRAGMLHERLGRYLWANGNLESESIGAYMRAVDLVPEAPSAERARALNGLASALAYADRPDPIAWCTEALRVAREAGARGEEGRALQSLGYCSAMAGDVEGGLAHCEDALVIAGELGQSEEQYRAFVNLVGVLRMAGRTVDAAATALRGVEVARRRGADRTYGNLLLGDAIDALILLGRWDEADELLPDEPDVWAHGTAVIATNLWLSAANLHTWRGRFDLSKLFLDACTATYATHGHGHVRSMLHANLAELCIWQGRFAEASQWISTELDLLGNIEFTSLLSRIVLQGLRAEAGLSRHLDLPRLTDLLEEMSRRPKPPPDAAAILDMSWAELARVQGKPDPDRWAVVADHFVKLDMGWPLAYSRLRQAEALLAGRPAGPQRRAGAATLSEAYVIASRLRAEPLRQEIASLARRARLMSVVAPAQRRAHEAGTLPTLTAREHEVLELICGGATNRRIASQLFISEKTVSIHVSHILAKLDAANRSEAAAIAHRTGLV